MQWLAHHLHHSRDATDHPAGHTTGWVMNWGWRYDLTVWALDTLLFRGKLRAVQERAVEVAAPQPGENVLDVGCGTGVMSLLAKERVGPSGRVVGIDPGVRQLARARSRAAARSLDIDFQLGVIEKLAFADRSFGVVLSSLMMHHLPDDLKRRGLFEILRVLEPDGRLVIVDFERPEARPDKPTKFGAGEIGIQDQAAIVKQAGFVDVVTGDLTRSRIPGLAGVGWLSARKASDAKPTPTPPT